MSNTGDQGGLSVGVGRKWDVLAGILISLIIPESWSFVLDLMRALG